jgi:hypothetical protein
LTLAKLWLLEYGLSDTSSGIQSAVHSKVLYAVLWALNAQVVAPIPAHIKVHQTSYTRLLLALAVQLTCDKPSYWRQLLINRSCAVNVP